MANSRDMKLISSLVGYVNDIKPYHSKLKDFTSELFFNDTVLVTIEDQRPDFELTFKNIWTKDDDPSLSFISEGGTAGLELQIPAAVYPRFSLNSYIGQTPPGDDPATTFADDLNLDGVPDSEVPYAGQATPSHRNGSNPSPYRASIESVALTNVTVLSHVGTIITGAVTFIIHLDPSVLSAYGIPLDGVLVKFGAEERSLTSADGETLVFLNAPLTVNTAVFTVPTIGSVAPDDITILEAFARTRNLEVYCINDTGRFDVPFHTGSFVTVNGAPQLFGSDYIVARNKSAIQFMSGRHPAAGADVRLNLFNSDRLFIRYTNPFVYDLDRSYGGAPYDILPYDSLGLTGLESDSFDITVDDGAPGRNIVTFNDVAPNPDKAVLAEVLIYPSQLAGTVWRLTAVSFFTLRVERVLPTPSPPELAYLGTRFDNGLIAFTLTAPWFTYYLVHDNDSYIAYETSLFDDRGADAEPVDDADFWPSSKIVTEHGVIVDPVPPRHAPVFYSPIGRVKRTSDGGYAFEFDQAPPRGTYVELRVEQARQYNPRVQASIREELRILVARSDTATLELLPIIYEYRT